MNMTWASHWGNYLVTHRTPENWRRYGEEAGRFSAENEWDEFLFYRDARNLALTEKAIQQKTEREVGDLGSLRLYGSDMHSTYGHEAGATQAESRILSEAFRKAYTKVIEAKVDELVPRKLLKNLDLFCNLIGWLRIEMDHGDGRGADYGLRMGGRKKKEEAPAPPKPTYKPTEREKREHASKVGRAHIERAWIKYMKRQSDGADLRSDMAHFNFHFPDDWDVDEVDNTTGAKYYVEAFRKALGEKALELAPASAWENSYLICSLYDQMLAQMPRKKEGYVSSSESRPRKGFWAKSHRADYIQGMERREWESKTRAEIRKQLEKEAAKQAKAKMSGPASAGAQALVIVHLSSLDSYTAHAGSEEGKLLGERLTMAILEHDGPVIIIDQGWETGYRESRPRENLLEEISGRRDIVWIQFDEAVENWEDFFPKLYAALDEQGATSAIVGGIWYDESLHTGCATFTYLTLKQRMPVTVDESLVGCE